MICAYTTTWSVYVKLPWCLSASRENVVHQIPGKTMNKVGRNLLFTVCLPALLRKHWVFLAIWPSDHPSPFQCKCRPSDSASEILQKKKNPIESLGGVLDKRKIPSTPLDNFSMWFYEPVGNAWPSESHRLPHQILSCHTLLLPENREWVVSMACLRTRHWAGPSKTKGTPLWACAIHRCPCLSETLIRLTHVVINYIWGPFAHRFFPFRLL